MQLLQPCLLLAETRERLPEDAGCKNKFGTIFSICQIEKELEFYTGQDTEGATRSLEVGEKNIQHYDWAIYSLEPIRILGGIVVTSFSRLNKTSLKCCQ